MPRALIIGYGNPLRGDDGLGWHVAERLRSLLKGPDAEVLAVQQLTPELMEPISRAERVIFIDASAEGTPGEVRERVISPTSEDRVRFTHSSSPEGLLSGALCLYGRAPEAILLTVGASQFDFGANLSPLVREAADRLVAKVSASLLS